MLLDEFTNIVLLPPKEATLEREMWISLIREAIDKVPVCRWEYIHYDGELNNPRDYENPHTKEPVSIELCFTDIRCPVCKGKIERVG